MNRDYMLEICVDSFESAMAAVKGGAKRLELCQDLIIGGTTPSLILFEMIRRNVSIPVHVLIRPRFGDFLYSEWEYERMCREISAFVSAGADGVVIGSLDQSGNLNLSQMQGMIRCAKEKHITLHRAFDMCADPYKALEEAKQLGVQTILTSGQKNTCVEGMALLKDLVSLSGKEIRIMAGAGVTAENLQMLYDHTGITDYHLSAKRMFNSTMQYRNEQVNMGLPVCDEYTTWRTDEEAVGKANEILTQIFG